jgi:ABC-type transport system substrate-binding protein
MTGNFVRGAALTAMLATTSLVPALSAHAETPTKGGNIVVTFKDDIATLDPAIGYDWQNWSMINAMFARLVDYKPGTTELAPSLAESYEVSPDGKTYTFKLHKAQFANGREITANDVKYSIERTINPKTQSPGAGFYHSIVGYDAMAAGTAQSVEGILAVDDNTVKFNLTEPDATFLNVLALNFASVVPKEAVEAAGADFGKHPVGSGAFNLKEWTVGQRLVFERNPNYFIKDRPHLDGYKVEIGQEPLVALLRLQKGEVDIAGDGIPPAKFLEMKKSPDYAGMIVDRQQLETSYVTLNTQVKPLDDARVRKALNMAVNKDRIVRIINGRAEPASQVLPPMMSGYDKSYKGYPYDVAKAKALLAEAGLKDGFHTEIYTSNTDPQPRIAQAIQQDLAAIGVTADIKALANPNVIAAGGTQGGAPMVWSGGLGWIADFPDPSDFYGPILSCSAATAGGWNWSWYCNKDIEPRAHAADAMPLPAKAKERDETWSKIFTEIQEKDAPWIPVFNERRVVAKSKRMGGPDEIYIDPTRVIDYEAIYVNK